MGMSQEGLGVLRVGWFRTARVSPFGVLLKKEKNWEEGKLLSLTPLLHTPHPKWNFSKIYFRQSTVLWEGEAVRPTVGVDDAAGVVVEQRCPTTHHHEVFMVLNLQLWKC